MAQPPLSPLRRSVRTASGQSLGTVVDVTIDPDSQSVLQYHVKPSRLVPDAMWAPLLIHRTQVVSITAEELVVDDGVVLDRAPGPNLEPSR